MSTDPRRPAGWYSDPTRRYQFRYWDGDLWSDNVATGATTALDPIAPELAGIPPAPGTEAPEARRAEPAPAPAPTVQVSGGGSTGLGLVIGVLLALVAGALVLFFVLGGDDDPTDPTEAPTVETTLAPETPDTEAPQEEEPAPEDAPTTTAAS